MLNNQMSLSEILAMSKAMQDDMKSVAEKERDKAEE